MKDFLRRIGHGIAYGIGIAIALGVAVLVMNIPWLNHPGGPAAQARSQLKITESRDATTPMGRTVVGLVTNAGPEESTGQQILVDFFDKDGRLVDTCSDYVSSGMPSGSSTSFKISCGDPDAPRLLPHATFKVRLEAVSDDGGP